MLDLTEYTWLHSKMRLPYDFVSEGRRDVSVEEQGLLNTSCRCKNGSAGLETLQRNVMAYNYSKHETTTKISRWKAESENTIEVMYVKLSERLSVGKLIMMATAFLLLIMVCVYAYRKQRQRAKRRQIEMIWVKVRHSLFV